MAAMVTTAPSALGSLREAGSKLWLDSIDPLRVGQARALGLTGAASNPTIICELAASGRFDDLIASLAAKAPLDDELAWRFADRLAHQAEELLLPIWRATGGDDGHVSLELDPLLEDPAEAFPHQARVERYVELARRWSRALPNRLIKLPATPAGLDALEEVVAAGVNVNVTLIFTPRQQRRACEAVWRGALRRASLAGLKSVYSVFVSRLDLHAPSLPISPAARRLFAAALARRIWAESRGYWAERTTPLAQEVVFASTGVKRACDAPWRHVEELSGGDILTLPPETLEAIAACNRCFPREVERRCAVELRAELEAVDLDAVEAALLEAGVRRFVEPQRRLLQLVHDLRIPGDGQVD